MDIHQRLALSGIAIPELLLPEAGVDLEKWAVIACDQFTQDHAYWAAVKKLVGACPSTLNLILPEILLAELQGAGIAARVAAIHDTMATYLEGLLVPCERGAVYIERKTPFHEQRRGLVLCVDLEQYDWKPEARPLIRSTEGTVEERLPPRMAVRRDAVLETSHILLLIDDEDDALLSALGEHAKQAEPLYTTELSMGSGAVSGWLLKQEADWAYLAAAFEGLVARSGERYGGASDAPFLFAVGDGNHSLASAKAIWLEYKAAHSGEEGLTKHPARYALVEIENLYDAGIAFEPIHRVIFGASFVEISAVLAVQPAFSSCAVASREELAALVGDAACERNRLGLVSGDSYLLVESERQGLATDTLQPLLDAFVASNAAYSIDYIHGEDSLFQTAQGDAVGLLLPPIDKRDLFKTVARRGPLPRKSFSMGEAKEKRFYLECRTLFR
ncbi:MAG: DUF1015 domain-containing protein [Treponema sp.]|jgi:uncharacterized protein (DUF1015 family)|nr:DUF1015 domain-containing protein [Treponema sp.]